MATWWYAKNGERFGPVEEADLRSKLISAEVQPTDLVWTEGMDQWQAAMEVFPAEPSGVASAPAVPAPAYPTPGTLQATAPDGESKALSMGLKDYGDILCWGVAIILIPCLGFLGYIGLIVLFILEFIEVKKAVEEGRLKESQYSQVHPALLGVGLFCCSIIFYPLFMHWRNQSGYFKPQPHAVWFAIVIMVVSIGVSLVLNLGQYLVQAAAESGQL